MKLSDIRKLCDEATPGPWTLSYHQLVSRTVDPDGITGKGIVMNMPGINQPKPANLDFIIVARDLMPKLLAVAEASMRAPIREGWNDEYCIGSEAEELLDAHLQLIDALKALEAL